MKKEEFISAISSEEFGIGNQVKLTIQNKLRTKTYLVENLSFDVFKSPKDGSTLYEIVATAKIENRDVNYTKDEFLLALETFPDDIDITPTVCDYNDNYTAERFYLNNGELVFIVCNEYFDMLEVLSSDDNDSSPKDFSDIESDMRAVLEGCDKDFMVHVFNKVITVPSVDMDIDELYDSYADDFFTSLNECDGEFISSVYNEVCTKEVSYLEDSLWELKGQNNG